MSPPTFPFEEPMTEHEFQEQLISLIRSAHANGVDIKGGWSDRTPPDGPPSWGIEIYEVIEKYQDNDVG